MSGMRNLLAADKDRKILRDMYFFARDVVEWDHAPNENLTLREHYESLNAALLELDSALMKRNGISGLVGLVDDNYAVNVFRYLPGPYFQAAPGYRSVPQPTMSGASSASSTSTATRTRQNTPASPSPAVRNTDRPAMSAAMPCPHSPSVTPFWATSSPARPCGTWPTATFSPSMSATI